MAEVTQADREARRIAEVMDEDGGCWSPCSGCQESCDGYVSGKDYPYDARFKCQPGSGCRECGGIGVIWQDGAYLSSWGDVLAEEPTRHRTEAVKPLVEALARISAMCPATCDMSTAHMMAEEADAALRSVQS